MARVEVVAGGRGGAGPPPHRDTALAAVDRLWPLTADAGPDPDRPTGGVGFCHVENTNDQLGYGPTDPTGRPLPDPHARKATR